MSGTPSYGTGLTASKFTTITRSDGTKQLAYNGKPLYGFASRSAPGDTTGQGVGGFSVSDGGLEIRTTTRCAGFGTRDGECSRLEL